MSERLARAALTRLSEPGEPRLAGLVAELGAVTVYDHLRQERDVGGVYSDVATRLRGLDPERDLSDAQRLGIRFVIPGDPEWPAQLADLDAAEAVQRRGGAPIGLWVKGRLRLDEVTARAVAVVGSRSATSYGAGVAAEIGAAAVRSGITVVSGAAFGIDQAGHRGALSAGGPTVAVLAGGVDRPYPAAHVSLLEHIAEQGVVVSELPPGCSPTRLRFLARNRLIAALSQGVVVVEAALRSGALNTANWSTRLNRPLMGVPGPVTSAQSQGVHELIRTGKAVLVEEGRHVLELVSPSGSFALAPARGEWRERDGLEERELRVLDALPVVRGVSVDSLSRTSGLAPAAVLEGLELLARLGLAEQAEGVWRLAASPRRATG